ncbi:MAG: hypothetical protein Edafosvirus16_2 [Edafosvirus sp.]|uniref:Uncharacterized protein n=1 Tax=Edafosvirus sp. TaxID=2487765 RepID=A0A3G4ZY53_9VIRU|nr:MAG: hypothetical protein Edafosvirus16_2 [Edafosvirus sp.]
MSHSYIETPRIKIYNDEFIDKTIIRLLEEKSIASKDQILLQEIYFYCYCNCCCACGGQKCRQRPTVTLIAWNNKEKTQIAIFEITIDDITSKEEFRKIKSFSCYDYNDYSKYESMIIDWPSNCTTDIDFEVWLETIKSNKNIKSWSLSQQTEEKPTSNITQAKLLKTIYDVL